MNKPVTARNSAKAKPEQVKGKPEPDDKVKSEPGAQAKPAKNVKVKSERAKAIKVKPEPEPDVKAKSEPCAQVKSEKNVKVKPEQAKDKPGASRAPRQKSKQVLTTPPASNFRRNLLLISLEVSGLIIIAVSAIMVILGYSANWFSGTRFFTSLLPFAIGVLGLILLAVALLIGWWKLRKWSQGRAALLAPILSVSLALVIGWFVMQDQFVHAFGHFRTLVGGKQEASRVTLAHQVYAAYRRHDAEQLYKLINRAQGYNKVIKEAANVFEIDPNLLQGIAAAESSFLPRDSKDGGYGLFQITLVPKVVMEQAAAHLKVAKVNLLNPRHNALIAAATLKYYLDEMNNDLFLGLLAYNIGPANGGLRFIMQEYGATDFITVQPYLQQLPRDYPIRVLSYSLAFRLWQKEGKLLAYEEGKNALHIQRIGIPGLLMDF
jgi:sorbitol-specific phosphotransferase system component IIC